MRESGFFNSLLPMRRDVGGTHNDNDLLTAAVWFQRLFVDFVLYPAVVFPCHSKTSEEQ